MTILVTSLVGYSQTLDSLAIAGYASQVRAGSAASPSTALANAVTAKTIQIVDIDYRGAEVLQAARTLTANDTGKKFFLDSATEFAVTLPAPELGLEFEIIVKAAPASASYTILTNGMANVLRGSVYSSDLNAAGDGDIETSGGDTLTLVDAKAVAGDRVKLLSDGTYWYAHIFVSAFDAATITTAA